MFRVFTAEVAVVPLNVWVAVNVCAVLIRAIFAPAKVDAPVPPLAIGSIPDTSAVKDTAPNVGAPDAFPCKTVVVVPAAVVAKAVVVLAYVIPYCVKALD